MKKASFIPLLLLVALSILSCGGDLTPTVPAGLTATATSPVQVTLSWTASSDDIKLEGYKIYRGGTLLAIANSASYSDTGLKGNTEHCYRVASFDAKDNESAKSNEACATTPEDTSAPSVPSGLKATTASDGQINLSWGASTDNAFLSGYRVYRGGSLIATVTSNSYSDTGLSASTQYCYVVSAFDSSGNESSQSSQSCATTASGSISTLTALAVTTSRIDLSWSAASDSGIAGYRIYRDGALLSTATSTKYSDTGLAESVEHCYRVRTYYTSGAEASSYKEVCAKPLSWATETVDGSGDVGLYSSLKLDGSGKAHISYSDYDSFNDDFDLKYSTNASGSFVSSLVDGSATTDDGEFCSLVLDSGNKAHVSYLSNDGIEADLKYADNALGGFNSYTVDVSGIDINNVGYYTSIALDELGKAHISYYDYTNGDLKYAVGSPGSWQTDTVDSAGDVGRDTSIARRGSATHISYYDDTDDDLKYATGSLGSWTVAIVDSETTSDGGSAGLYTSIAIDSNNKAHISYFEFIDATHGKLKYTTNASGSWVITTVDASGNSGTDTSIALDSNNKVHISYYDVTNGDLKYASNASGSWVTSTVDGTGDVGQFTSIAVDSDDRIHISYYDVTNENLIYTMSNRTLVGSGINTCNSYCSSSSGACSSHGGVNCSAGPASNGMVQCNDGSISPSVEYLCH